MRIFLIIFAGALVFGGLAPYAQAATNISATTTDHWAWNDSIGWIDLYNTNTVNVQQFRLTGYASSSAGDISFDCATTRIGDICGTSNYYVSNDGLGNLRGWAWNDTYGWISFCGGQSAADCPGAVSYQVKVNPDSGIFTDTPVGRNYAWNDILGWISFNCDNHGCPPTYKVATSWFATSTDGYLDSTVYDTGVSGGAQINSIMWRGTQPSDTSVKFQFAVSNNPSGPWTYMGSDGTSNTYFTTGPDVLYKVGYSFFNNFRYFRYRATLVSNRSQTETPRIDEVIVNWSP